MIKLILKLLIINLFVKTSYACPDAILLEQRLMGAFKGVGYQLTKSNDVIKDIESTSSVELIEGDLFVNTKTAYLIDGKVIKIHNSKYWIVQASESACDGNYRVYKITSKSSKGSGYNAYFDGESLVSKQDLGSKMIFEMKTSFLNKSMTTNGLFKQDDRIIQKTFIEYDRVE